MIFVALLIIVKGGCFFFENVRIPASKDVGQGGLLRGADNLTEHLRE